MPKSRDYFWAIDGVEEQTARIEEDGTRFITVPRYLLPAKAREGQVLRMTRTEERGVVSITLAVDNAATAAALDRSSALVKRAATLSKKRDPGGDVVL